MEKPFNLGIIKLRNKALKHDRPHPSSKEPAALHLTRREDLLDIRLEHPDLSVYESMSDD